MLSIDEAIIHAREMAEKLKSKYVKCPTRTRYNCKMCFHEHKCDEDAKQHEQLALWLEELKEYKSIGTVNGYIEAIEAYTREHFLRKSKDQKHYNNGYNKAIDDFFNELLQYEQNYNCCGEMVISISAEELKEEAEQLKKGLEDGSQ